MGTLWCGTRRSIFQLALDGLFAGATSRLCAAPAFQQRMEYRVNAAVVVAYVPVLFKQNVGGACLTVEQTAVGQETVTRLDFAAGTWPHRLKGFNRFGATRETVREENGALTESAYVSFMASSHEKNFSEAREAFRTSPHSLPITVAQGRSTSAGCVFRIEHSTVPADSSWQDCLDLADAFEQTPLPPAAPDGECAARVLPTFLYTLRRVLLSDPPAATTFYTHNGKVYRLRTRSQVAPYSNQVVLDCSISGGTEFKLWLDSRNRNALPLKIEFRPKSFLRLTLEQEKHEPDKTSF